MFFHLSEGQPVMPSRVQYRLYRLQVRLACCVSIPTLDNLAALGLKASSFGRLSYAERQQAYPRPQDIAEAAYFHGRDGLMVPSARAACANLVIFCTQTDASAVEIVEDGAVVDWEAWRTGPVGIDRQP
jgi:hypothetical protein